MATLFPDISFYIAVHFFIAIIDFFIFNRQKRINNNNKNNADIHMHCILIISHTALMFHLIERQIKVKIKMDLYLFHNIWLQKM